MWPCANPAMLALCAVCGRGGMRSRWNLRVWGRSLPRRRSGGATAGFPEDAMLLAPMCALGPRSSRALQSRATESGAMCTLECDPSRGARGLRRIAGECARGRDGCRGNVHISGSRVADSAHYLRFSRLGTHTPRDSVADPYGHATKARAMCTLAPVPSQATGGGATVSIPMCTLGPRSLRALQSRATEPGPMCTLECDPSHPRTPRTPRAPRCRPRASRHRPVRRCHGPCPRGALGGSRILHRAG